MNLKTWLTMLGIWSVVMVTAIILESLDLLGRNGATICLIILMAGGTPLTVSAWRHGPWR